MAGKGRCWWTLGEKPRGLRACPWLGTESDQGSAEEMWKTLGFVEWASVPWQGGVRGNLGFALAGMNG